MFVNIRTATKTRSRLQTMKASRLYRRMERPWSEAPVFDSDQSEFVARAWTAFTPTGASALSATGGQAGTGASTGLGTRRRSSSNSGVSSDDGSTAGPGAGCGTGPRTTTSELAGLGGVMRPPPIPSTSPSGVSESDGVMGTISGIRTCRDNALSSFRVELEDVTFDPG